MTRQKPIRVSTEDIQGPGSYICVRRITWGEAQSLAKSMSDKEAIPIGKQIASLISEWNWTDEDGKPLALPKDDSTVLDACTIDEIKALREAITNAYQPPKVSETLSGAGTGSTLQPPEKS